MKNNKSKFNLTIMISFFGGLVIYLIGLFLLFGASVSKLEFLRKIFGTISLTDNAVNSMKLYGLILFLIGFVIFMVAVILLYKNNEITENVRELVIEGKADVITIVVMTYVLIFMLVICLLFDEVIGALLFGIAIMVQSILNTVLIKYFKNRS